MDIGKGHGNGVLDQKLLRSLRVMGITVDQGLDQVAVLDADHFVVMERNFHPLAMKQIALGFQFIASDIGFVKNRMIHDALAQEIASGQARVTELKVQWMMRREAVKGIEPGKLVEGNELVNVRAHIEGRVPKVDGDTVNDAIDKPFEFCHELLLLRKIE